MNQVLDLKAFDNARPAQAFAALNPQDDQLSEGIGSSYGIIGYKGKNWTLRWHGEKKQFTRPDDGTAISYIDVIILRAAGHKSKSYYAAFDPNASEGARPICASLDGITPDADVQQRQADACAICPRNVWRTNQSGRRERDCSDYKRLSVLLLPAQTQRMFGQAIMEPVFLRVPAGSLENLMRMSDQMKAKGFHSATYVTRISFEPTEAHPLMIFTPIQALTDAEGPVVMPLVNSEEAKRITGEDVMGRQRHSAPALAAPGTVTTGLVTGPAVVQPVVQTQQPVSAAALVQQAKVDTQPVAVAPGQPNGGPVSTGLATGLDQNKPNNGPVQTGLLAVAEAGPNPSVMAAPVQQTQADVGLPQESDAAMDERIASVLGVK